MISYGSIIFIVWIPLWVLLQLLDSSSFSLEFQEEI